jgi:hypothetical protein
MKETSTILFKAYIRKLRRHLQRIEGLLKIGETEKALEEMKELLKDTNSDLEG